MTERDSNPLGARTPPLDAPRPLPHGLRGRLEDALLDAADGDDHITSLPWAELDRPRTLPATARARIESSLVSARRAHGWRQRRVIGAAAAAVLLAGVAVLAANDGDRVHRVAAPPTTAATEDQSSTGDGAAASGDAAPDARGDELDDSATAGGRSGSAAGMAASGGAAASVSGGAGPPPPFAAGPDRGVSSPSGANQSPARGAPLRVGVVRGDPVPERGFRSYVDLLNRSGGISGRAVTLIEVSPGRPASAVVATVNLDAAAIATTAGAPSWAGAPLLEGLSATEAVLRGNVYSFAGPIERQARLAADATYSSPAPGETAVVYRAEAGVFATAVPEAIRGVLTGRGVTVVESVYRGGPPATIPGADAIFLSLDRAAGAEWLRARSAAGSAVPRRGVTGLHTIFEASAATNAPAGTRVLSPYLLPTGDEAQALEAGLGERPGAAAVHGWATAKSLAVALWRSGAMTPEAASTALDQLTGYASGLAPPYEVRPGTHSRTPEAAPFEARNQSFVQTGEFRRDPT